MVGLAMVVWLMVRFAPLGWNPTDDGYILSQSNRLLHGFVPHRELISPRPLGSAVLHIFDIGLGRVLPLLDAGRLVYLMQMVLTTTLFARLTYTRRVGEWGPLHVAGAAGALLVNLHVFPFMPWHTTDGMLFVAAGAVLLMSSLEEEGSARRRLLAFVLFGVAVLMKQSFVIAPVLGLGWVGLARWREGVRPLVREVIIASLGVGAPILIYVGLVAGLGGAGEMVLQLRNASRSGAGMPVIDIFKDPVPRRALLGATAAVIVPSLLIGALERLRSARTWFREAALCVARLAIFFVIVRVSVSDQLAYGQFWGVKLMWMLAAVLALRGVIYRRLDMAGWTIFATALMASVSWGYAVPNLMTGTMSLLILHRTWEGGSVPARHPAALHRVAISLATVIALVVVGREFVQARSRWVYFEEPEPSLTVALDSVDDDFGRVRVDPTTARYVRELVTCIRSHPARFTAVLPDNPGIYPLLGLESPFSIDWMLPDETRGMQRRLVEDAERLDRRGEYLVLFQTFSAFALHDAGRYPAATPHTQPFFYGTPLGDEILAALKHGEPVACGGFVGVYAPRPSD